METLGFHEKKTLLVLASKTHEVSTAVRTIKRAEGDVETSGTELSPLVREGYFISTERTQNLNFYSPLFRM